MRPFRAVLLLSLTVSVALHCLIGVWFLTGDSARVAARDEAGDSRRISLAAPWRIPANRKGVKRPAGPAVDLYVEAPKTLVAGTRAGARVATVKTFALDRVEPFAGALVEVYLRSSEEKLVFSGKTGEDGRVEAAFDVPDVAPAAYILEVRAGAPGETLSTSQQVQVRPAADAVRILLVSDKPLYQPCQVMHLRALALREDDLHPAAGTVVFEVEDSKGNKVFKRPAELSAHGVASTDFQLADEVLLGDYRASAKLGNASTEKTVAVKKYVLPKFKVVAGADKAWYLPREVVKGTVQADYFFGKPVAGAEVKVKASTFDAAFHEFATVSTKTDAAGAAEFEVTLPDYFAGQPLEKGNAYVQLEVSVTDGAEHAESVVKTFNVANGAIQLAAVPESGKLVPGVENVVYVVATAPDGSPVECDVELGSGGERWSAATDATGIAEVRLVPPAGAAPAVKFTARAADRMGNKAESAIVLSSEVVRDQVLLRLDRAIARAGESVGVEILGTFDSGKVFLDVVRGGRAVRMTSCDMVQGRARLAVEIPPSEFGATEFHAYKLLATGELVRDTRLLYVQPADELKIDMTADRESWRPGERAAIDFQVTGRDGKGAAAALGVVVVDESVYALQDMQPGLERVYFTLAKELQDPKYGLKTGRDLASVVRAPGTAAPEQRIAQVLLAPVQPASQPWQATTLTRRSEALRRKQALVCVLLEKWIMLWGREFAATDPATGKRGFRPDLLQEIAADPRVKIGETTFTDPWGNEITLDALAKQHPAFTFDFWTNALMTARKPALFEAMRKAAAAGTLLRGEGFAPGARAAIGTSGGAPAELLKDAFGEPLDLDALAVQDPAFSPANFRRLLDNERRAAIWGALRDRCAAGDGLVRPAAGKWAFRDGIDAALGVPLDRPGGGTYAVADLAAQDPAFSPDNMALVTDIARRQALGEALVMLARKEGFGTMAQDEGAWAWTPGLPDRLVAAGLLTDAQARDTAGARWVLEALGAADRRFTPEGFLAAFNSGAGAKISAAVCQHIHQGGPNALPADALDRLVTKGALTREELLDAWGRPLAFQDLAAGETTSLGCGLLSGRKKLVSAGPDGVAGTKDDVRCEGSDGANPWAPAWAGCRVFQKDALAIEAVTADAWRIIGGRPAFLQALGYSDEPAIFFPDAEESDHNESYGEMKGDGVEFLAASPGLARPRNVHERKGVYDTMGVGAGGGAYGGRMGGRRNLIARGGGTMADEPPGDIRVRQDFPETLLWRPLLVTDDQGRARLEIDLADSITTWRLTASASAMDGRLGSATRGLLVFQPFFVDIDFPVALTQNDSVSVPVAVYNYLKEPQQVSLKLLLEDWFELDGDPRATLALEPGEVRAVKFRIRAKGLGRRRLTVYAWGADEAARDAIRREVDIVPDGKMVEIVWNDRLGGPLARRIALPGNSIPGTTKIFAKVYPGVFSQVVEGVEGMLGMPHG
ncbi:MAG: hypothetical protein HYY18_11420 [Planctomycetes bacterium]|nr:hypothetical protein [Planctomycetota bacterium]